jgi:ferredoxin--NADP+ reductase
VLEQELYLDRVSSKQIEGDTAAQKNIDYLRAYAEIGSRNKPRQVHFRFLISPVEIIADERGKICAVRCERNKLLPTEDGKDTKAVGAGEFETIPAGMVLRSVGYRGAPLPGVPFDKRSGVILNRDGRVVDDSGQVIPGQYVVGWAKRGPTGVIGTNKPDAHETVNEMVADLATTTPAPNSDPNAIIGKLSERGVRFVTQEEWNVINEAEVKMGKAQNRPRVKIISKQAMLRLLTPGARKDGKLELPTTPGFISEMQGPE